MLVSMLYTVHVQVLILKGEIRTVCTLNVLLDVTLLLNAYQGSFCFEIIHSCCNLNS